MSQDFASGDFERLANQAYIYTLPLVVMEMTRKWRMKNGANRFNHSRKLSNHRSRTVTTPNNDTLYSDAWLDLSHGPVTITVPPTGDRYFSLTFMDMYTNNFAILGTRTTGVNGGVYTVVGPNDATPEGVNDVIRAPTPRVWALIRTLVDSAEDLAAAHAVQDGFFVHEGANGEDIAPGDPTLRSAGWKEYFAAANRLLKRERPPVTDGGLLESIAPLSIGPDQTFDPSAFNDAQADAVAKGVQAAKDFLVRVQGSRGKVINGWTYPNHRLGNYFQEYTLRAVIAVGGLGALPPEEAMYMRADGEGKDGLFDGNRDYQLHFSADKMPPLKSFWSLSLYEATDDGQFFFADTPQQRYIIGDRTPGLTFNDDGSLDIWIGANKPGEGKENNWLPSPAKPFALFFRGYIPKSHLLNEKYRLPAVKGL